MLIVASSFTRLLYGVPQQVITGSHQDARAAGTGPSPITTCDGRHGLRCGVGDGNPQTDVCLHLRQIVDYDGP